MKIEPIAPFVWPEPRILDQLCDYEREPPIDDLALQARSVFGIVTGLTHRGVQTVSSWLGRNPDLKLWLILAVYPTCPTRQSDLCGLLDVVERHTDRVKIKVKPLNEVADRVTTVLGFVSASSDVVHIATGAFEDLQISGGNGPALVFRGDAALVEAYRRYFDWCWARLQDVGAAGVTHIPALVVPAGTAEGSELWNEYLRACALQEASIQPEAPVVRVDQHTGEVSVETRDGGAIESATDQLGVPKLDPFAERVARLYEKGALVSVDKLSRIPPLDAPLDPRLFGDESELQRGNVTRKVSMRVSIIDEKELKEIEKRRQGLRTLLTKFTYALADNMRWMPSSARKLFEAELQRLNDEGLKLISGLIQGDTDEFIAKKKDALIKDLKAMYKQLGREENISDDLVVKVTESLKTRLDKAKCANFMPQISYSILKFDGADGNLVSPWGQASSLLSDIVAFPRKALTDGFFFRGLKVSEDSLIDAMDVADDALLRDTRTRNIKDRCRAELALVEKIEEANIDAKERCTLLWRILDGDPIEEIDKALPKAETAPAANPSGEVTPTNDILGGTQTS